MKLAIAVVLLLCGSAFGQEPKPTPTPPPTEILLSKAENDQLNVIFLAAQANGEQISFVTELVKDKED